MQAVVVLLGGYALAHKYLQSELFTEANEKARRDLQTQRVTFADQQQVRGVIQQDRRAFHTDATPADNKAYSMWLWDQGPNSVGDDAEFDPSLLERGRNVCIVRSVPPRKVKPFNAPPVY